MEPTELCTTEHEEVIARVGWAIFILSYLTQKRSHAELPLCDDDEEDKDEDHDEQGDLDADTERTVVLNGPEDSIRSKFLDCIAQLLSPSKGWHNVSATALREHEDHVAIDIARNDCFGKASLGPTDQNVCTFEESEVMYCSELTRYLSCQHGKFAMLLRQ